MSDMDGPVAFTKDGKVRGVPVQLQASDARTVYCFRNVPYAQPPVGKLRFLKPESVETWEGIRDCTSCGKIPMQELDSVKAEEPYFPQKSSAGEQSDMGEDCLYLSVYTTTTELSNLPVMVWIYGGSFQDGSARLYDGSALAGLHDVVVVIPNYRLNAFGFLSFGKGSICPGNAGLWDQNMALQWVQRNIAAFGGDPNNVTIFGESAGGMSVNHQLNSNRSRHLFNRAISHSGQAAVSEFFAADGQTITNMLLEHLGIKERDHKVILEKLQNMPAQLLSDANRAVVEKTSWRTRFVPCVDGEFLIKTPQKYLVDRDFAKIPYMIGCNNSEFAGGFALGLCGTDFAEKGIDDETFQSSTLFPVSGEDMREWKNLYSVDVNDRLAFSKLFANVCKDKIFVQPAVSTAKAHSDVADVYFYQACFQLKLFHDKDYGPQSGMKPDWCYCDHGDDVHIMLGTPFTPGTLRLGGRFSDEEKILSRTCMRYLTNFAKTGNPNEGSKVEFQWPKYIKHGKYINLDHNLSVGIDLAASEVRYWEEYQNKSQQEDGRISR